MSKPGQTIEAEEKPLGKVFGSDYRFKIPPYQRLYAWEPENATALLGDLQDAQGDLPDYFLGALVVVENVDDGFHDVIDGQQRLTTLTILFSVLAQLLPPQESEELLPFLQQKGNKIQGLQTTYRLTVRDQEREFFEQYVQTPGGIEKLLALEAEALTEVQVRIRGNAVALHSLLLTEDPETLSTLAAYMAQHVYLVVVSAAQFDTAYRIFTVMNDRGLELAASDILKATVVGDLPDALRRKYADTWESTEEVLGRDRFNELFSHIRMVRVRQKARRSLLREIQELILPNYQANLEAFVDDLVVPYGERLHMIRTESWKGTHAPDINRVLAWLNHIDNIDWIPPLLLIGERTQDSSAVLDFVKLLDKLTSSMYLRRVHVQPRLRRFGAVLEAIDGDIDLTSAESPLSLTEEEKRQTSAVLAGEVYGMSGGVPRYILTRLDAALADASAVWDHTVISVEHVLPQGPPEESQWTEWFSVEERQFWTHRLANLVPLSRRRNSAASNYDFDTKRHQYFAVEGQASPFVLTNQIISQNVWTPAVLESRQAKLVGVLEQVWDLHTSGTAEVNSN